MKEKGIDIVVLDVPFLETRGRPGHSGGEGVRDSAVRIPLSSRDLRNRRVIVKGVFLQKCLLFCK